MSDNRNYHPQAAHYGQLGGAHAETSQPQTIAQPKRTKESTTILSALFLDDMMNCLFPWLPIPKCLPPEFIVLFNILLAGASGYFLSQSIKTPWYGSLSAGLLILSRLGDYCDGRQARTTNQCSNHGELFDHQADIIALDMVFIGAGWAIDRWDLVCALVALLNINALLVFQEAYITLHLRMSMVGPDEAALIFILLGFVAHAGPLFKDTVSVHDIFLYFMYVGIGVGGFMWLMNLVTSSFRVDHSDTKPDTEKWRNSAGEE